ncbi:MAG: DUF2851 family protein [Bacteroidota bacterium]
MNEKFLQYIWEHKLYKSPNCTSGSGEKIEIIDPGKPNHDSGPDFTNARIKIDETIWAGNIEIHKNSSDWYNHNHQNDESYNSIILHVVEKDDLEVRRESGELIPSIELSYDKKLEKNYQHLIDSVKWIPCQDQLYKVDPFYLQFYLNSLIIERLESKTGIIQKLFHQNNNNWEETFYQYLARTFGFNLNSEPFELLARNTPQKLLGKHKNNLFQIEAILFGQAGMLDHTHIYNDYYSSLKKEYEFLKKKFNISPIPTHLWKFSKSRPANFPTIRIAQFSMLIQQSTNLFSKIIELKNLNDLIKLFQVKTSSFWETHYHFDNTSEKRIKNLGKSAIEIILINTIIPFLFFYGQQKDNQSIKDRAIQFIDHLPPEKNSIIGKWEKSGIQVKTALESQALIHLKNNYCDKKQCLKCQVGNKLINTN